MTRSNQCRSDECDAQGSDVRAFLFSLITRAYGCGIPTLRMDLVRNLVEMLTPGNQLAVQSERLPKRVVGALRAFCDTQAGRMLQFAEDRVVALSSAGPSAYRIEILLWRIDSEAIETRSPAPAYVAGTDRFLSEVVERRVRSLGIATALVMNRESLMRRLSGASAHRPVLYISVAESGDADRWLDAVRALQPGSCRGLLILLKHAETQAIVRWLDGGASVVLPWQVPGAVFDAYVRRLHGQEAA